MACLPVFIYANYAPGFGVISISQTSLMLFRKSSSSLLIIDGVLVRSDIEGESP
jgi:hypothetical protein